MISLFLVAMLLIGVPVMASAAIIDPYEYKTSVYVDGDNEVVNFALPDSTLYWTRYHDGGLADVGYGATFTYDTQMRYVDNDVVTCYLFGKGNFVATAGIPVDASFGFSFDYIGTNTDTTQTWDESLFVAVDLYDADYNLIRYVDVWTDSIVDNGPGLSVKKDVDGVIAGAVLAEATYFRVRFVVDFSDVAVETDTTSVVLELQNWYSAFSVPYSSLHVLKEQGALTNEHLEQIDAQLQANGQTLDDILAQQQANGDKLDDLISGGAAGDDLIAGGDKIEDAGAGLGDDIGEIQDFEDQYMGQLEDNLDEVIAGADLTWLYPPLMFVQRYLNKIVAGIPSKYLIVFTLPMLFGIFMYIVGHPIRAPRPDTSGDTVTRETFTETTILTGPKAGQRRSTRTVTTSQEIGRVHNE